jgi:hypothetical protein
MTSQGSRLQGTERPVVKGSVSTTRGGGSVNHSQTRITSLAALKAFLNHLPPQQPPGTTMALPVACTSACKGTCQGLFR